MTIDWQGVSKRCGFNDIRELIIVKYYLEEKSIELCAEECAVDPRSFGHLMEYENFPRRGAHRIIKHGFYCQVCGKHRAWHDLKFVRNAECTPDKPYSAHFLCHWCARKYKKGGTREGQTPKIRKEELELIERELAEKHQDVKFDNY